MKIKVQGEKVKTNNAPVWVKLESENLNEAVQLGRISARANRQITQFGNEFHVELPFSELVTLAAK